MSSLTLTNAARQKLQVTMTPAKTLAQALGEFCTKFDLDASEYTLVHNKKTLDLALAFRLSGVNSNATLEVRKAATSSKAGDESSSAQIQVAVTLDGARHIVSFSSNTTVWNILKSVESEKNVPLLTASSTKKLKNGEILTFYNQPIVNFMSTDLQTNSELRKTTLAALGVKSGSAVLRVRFKPTEVPLKTFLEEDGILAETEAQEAKVVEQRITDAKVAMQLKQQEDAERRAQEAARRQEEENDRILATQMAQKLRDEEAKNREMDAPKHSEMAPNSEMASSSSSSPQPSSSAMQVDREVQTSAASTSTATHPQQPPRKKFEVVVEPPGPPGLMKTFLEGGMIDEDHASLHEALRKQKDEIEQANKIPDVPCPRDVQVFAPSTTPFDPSSLVFPDDFFDVSASDVSKAKTAKTASDPYELKTKSMKEKERLQKLARFKKCFVRFRFPDKLELQASFYPQEKTEHLVAFLRTHLVDPNLNFYLFTTPPTTNLHNTKNIRDQGFLPAALVHVGLAPGANAVSPFLKPEVLELIKEKAYVPVVHEYKHTTEMQFVGASSATHESISAATASSSAMDVDDPKSKKPEPEAGAKKDEKKVPKWFSAGMKSKK